MDAMITMKKSDIARIEAVRDVTFARFAQRNPSYGMHDC
jgi:hypothetical protein